MSHTTSCSGNELQSPCVVSSSTERSSTEHEMAANNPTASSFPSIRKVLKSTIYMFKLIKRIDTNNAEIVNLSKRLDKISDGLKIVIERCPAHVVESIKHLCHHFNDPMSRLYEDIERLKFSKDSDNRLLKKALQSMDISKDLQRLEKRLHDIVGDLSLANSLKSQNEIGYTLRTMHLAQDNLFSLSTNFDGWLMSTKSTSPIKELTNIPNIRLGDLVIDHASQKPVRNEKGYPVGLTARARVEPSRRARSVKVLKVGDRQSDLQVLKREISFYIEHSNVKSIAPIFGFVKSSTLNAVIYQNDLIPMENHLCTLSSGAFSYFMFINNSIHALKSVGEYFQYHGLHPHYFPTMMLFMESISYVDQNTGKVLVVGDISRFPSKHEHYSIHFQDDLLQSSRNRTLYSAIERYSYDDGNSPQLNDFSTLSDKITNDERQKLLFNFYDTLYSYGEPKTMMVQRPLQGIQLDPGVYSQCIECWSRPASPTPNNFGSGPSCPYILLDALVYRETQTYQRFAGGAFDTTLPPGFHFTSSKPLYLALPSSDKKDNGRTLFSQAHRLAKEANVDVADLCICYPEHAHFRWSLTPLSPETIVVEDLPKVVWLAMEEPGVDLSGLQVEPRVSWTTELVEKKAEMIESGAWRVEVEQYYEVAYVRWKKVYWEALAEAHRLVGLDAGCDDARDLLGLPLIDLGRAVKEDGKEQRHVYAHESPEPVQVQVRQLSDAIDNTIDLTEGCTVILDYGDQQYLAMPGNPPDPKLIRNWWNYNAPNNTDDDCSSVTSLDSDLPPLQMEECERCRERGRSRDESCTTLEIEDGSDLRVSSVKVFNDIWEALEGRRKEPYTM